MMELYPAEIKITSGQEDKAYCLCAFYAFEWECQLAIRVICCTFKFNQLPCLLLTLLKADMDRILVIMRSAAYGYTAAAILTEIHVMEFQRYIVANSCDFPAFNPEGITVYRIIFRRIQLFICLLQWCKRKAG